MWLAPLPILATIFPSSSGYTHSTTVHKVQKAEIRKKLFCVITAGRATSLQAGGQGIGIQYLVEARDFSPFYHV
jgi:hypothetical protein